MSKKISDTDDTENNSTLLVEFYPEKATKKEMKNVPAVIRDRFVGDLQLLSHKLEPSSEVKKLESLGKGILELKKNGRPAWRCIYYTGVPGKIIVLHVTDKTAEGRDSQIANVVELRLKALRGELRAK